MAEIKSRWDIVMERTKHLTLSDDEKQAQRHQEFRKKVNGLVQRFMDKAIGMEHMRKDLNTLEKECAVTDKRVLSSDIAGRLRLNQDNQPFFALLNEICGLDTAEFQSVLDEYQETVVGMARRKHDEMKRHLAERHAVSGTAVVPNLEADSGWNADMQIVGAKFEGMLNQEKARLTAAG